MVFPLMMIVALAGSSVTSLPDGFNAQCKSDHEVEAYLPEAPTKDGRIMQDVTPDATQSVEITKSGGLFTVYSAGGDVQTIARDSPNFRVVVIKEGVGNLVISVTTTSMGSWTAIYHLQYQNHIGAMTMSRILYDGASLGVTALAVFHCSTSL